MVTSSTPAFTISVALSSFISAPLSTITSSVSGWYTVSNNVLPTKRSYSGSINSDPYFRVLTFKPRSVPQSSSRSEEHTSELQPRFDLVCRRLLEKKKYICRMEDWQYLIVYAYVGACFLSFVWATCHNNGNGLSNIRNFFNLENRTHSNG